MRTRIDVTERGTRDSAAGVARAGRGEGKKEEGGGSDRTVGARNGGTPFRAGRASDL